MHLLLSYVLPYGGDFGFSYGKCPIPALPGKVPQLKGLGVAPRRGRSLQVANQIGLSHPSGENQQQVHMILNSSHAERLAILVHNATKIPMHLRPQFGAYTRQWNVQIRLNLTHARRVQIPYEKG